MRVHIIRRKLRGAVAIVAASAMIFSGAYACGSEKEEPCRSEGGGAGGFMFGIHQVNLDDLDAKLKARGFEGLDASSLSFGGAGYGLIQDRIVIGGEGSGFSQKVESATQKATVSGGYGFFDVGYVVFSKGGLYVFPMVGLGGGGLSLEIWERGITPTFDEVLDDPKRETNISTASFLIQVGVGADYLLMLGRDKEGEGGLLFGLRVGYTFAPMKADWKTEHVDVLDGPDIGITGPYVRFVFGGGGKEK